jgi:hypothetical protein
MKYANHWASRPRAFIAFLILASLSGHGCFSGEFNVKDGTTIRADEIKIKKMRT